MSAIVTDLREWAGQYLEATPEGQHILTDAADQIEKLRAALVPFAEAATTLEREYNGALKFETGCNIKFAALVAARDVLTKCRPQA